MIFPRKKKNWDAEYDEYYTQHDPEYERVGKPRLWIHMAVLATIAAVFLVIVGAVAGQTMLERTLKALITPVGMVWLLLGLTVWFSLVYRAGWTAVAAAVGWLILTVGGNSIVADFATRSLESEFLKADPLQMEPVDVLVLLGGGTTMAPSGTSQLGYSGDRVMLAARLFHDGKAKRILATGTQAIRTDKNDWDPNREAVEILKDLEIEEQHLLMLGGAKNTSEEMAQLKKWLDEPQQADVQSVGILTSAWHLGRAMKLARANDIEAVPVPADFLTGPWIPDPGIVIPSANNLRLTGKAIHETAGAMIGR